MDLSEHHRQRLLELLAATGLNQAQFAEKCELQPNYVSRLLYPPEKKGRKNLGVMTIHKIVEGLGLSHGWFDLPLGAALPTSGAASEQLDLPVKDAHRVHDSVGAQRRATSANGVPWPFRIVSYQRIDRLQKHFGRRGMPNAIAEIDKYLDALVTRWESEMEKEKSSAA